MRDYDPTTGRYLQADPLGLVDGASVYGYALGNPGRWVDPRGLFVGIPASNPNAFFGNAMDFFSGVFGYFSGLYRCGEHCNNLLYEELWRRINVALDTNTEFRSCILDAILYDMVRHPFYYAGRGITAAGVTKALGAVSTPVSGSVSGATLAYLSIKGDVLASIASGVEQLDPRSNRSRQLRDIPLLHQFPAEELCKCILLLD